MPNDKTISQEGVPEVRTDSESHKDMFKTLVLLAIEGKERPIYFVVEGLGTYPGDRTLGDHEQYFYEQHTCPTNFVGGDVVNVYEGGDRDPHGVFRFIRAVWMPQRYVDAKNEAEERRHNMGWNPEDVIEDLFPELTEGHARPCLHQGKTETSDGFSTSIGMDGGSTMAGCGEYTHVHYVQPGEACTLPDRVIR